MSSAVEQEHAGSPNGDGDAAAQPYACPSCGTPAEPGQLMCLECGARLALDYKRPPTWRLPAAIVGAVVLIAGAATAFGLAQVTDDADKASSAPQPTQSVANQTAPGDTQAPTSPQPAPTSSTTTPEPTTTDEAPAETTTTPAPAPTGSETTWPDDTDAYSVILASETTESAAKAKQKEAEAAGITAGVLKSDEFPTLRAGYWVVFDGQLDSVEEATDRAEQDKGKGFGDAYPRFVSEDAGATPPG